MSKIVLGTAQFGLPYGVSNNRGQVQVDEIDKIWDVARAANITMLDTAIAYGRSEESIGATHSYGFEIVTKLPALSSSETSVMNWVQRETRSSLFRLRRTSLYGILLHNPADLVGARGMELVAALDILKSDGMIVKTGVSIYSPAELDAIVPQYVPDIVQAPLNVLDRSLETSGWLTRLHELNIEVHTRSVFLQGLLLQEPSARHPFFNPWSSTLAKFDSWVKSNNMSPLEACLGHVLSYPQISKVIIGVTSAKELREVVDASPVMPVRAPSCLQSTDQDLIQPSKWNYK